MAWSSIDLPSRGQAYNNLEGSVEIRPFTYEEEKLLRSISKVSQGKGAIEKIFDNCVKGVPYDALTIPDKSFILFKLREISYGNEYPVVFNCTNCQTDNRMRVEISELPVNYVDENAKGAIGIMLDDILAGIYSIICLLIIFFFLGG